MTKDPATRIRWGSPTVIGYLGFQLFGFGWLMMALLWCLNWGPAALQLHLPQKVVIMAAALLLVRMFFITGVFHRYFSHRSYKFRGITHRWAAVRTLARSFQFAAALGGTTAMEKGPLWWSVIHSFLHHPFSDQEGDPHRPQDGFWWAQCGWFLSEKYYHAPVEKSPFWKYPELRWLDRHYVWPVVALGLACAWWAGTKGVIGFVISTALLSHCVSFVNTLTHLFGRQAYPTGDNSRNSFAVAMITLGEGWHNNHHFCMTSVRQGFKWWQVDVTYYVLYGLRCTLIIHDFSPIPPRAFAAAP